jgi:small subunit ribosomal protein S11
MIEPIKENITNDIAIITISSTQNNTHLLAKNLQGKHLGMFSLGLVIKKKRGKRSVAMGAQLCSEEIANKLIDLGYSKLYIKVKGCGRGRESALFGLLSSGLIIEQIMDVTPIPHNGCRQKKSRRI